MSGKIPQNILEDILSRTDIVDLISGYIPLKKAGRNFRANCPFHHEKTPSFMVSSDKQIYHCFGCGESGNAFKFLMRHERMEFPEAVEFLAKKCGVVLPVFEKNNNLNSLDSSVYKVNELANEFFEGLLITEDGNLAKDYLLKRGISLQTLKEFRLGFAGFSRDGLISHLRAKGLTLSVIEKSGVAIAKESGGYVDRFRNRIIFPILDIRSRTIGFGGRVMDQVMPKYLNSPETCVYVKGKNLYGLNFSKDYIRDSDSVVIVEGYLDFIIPFQEGVKNIVASLGTALTLEQIRLLKRYTHNVVMIYDGDSAGELATLRNLDILITEGLKVKIVPLPKGFDPDLFVRKEGVGGLKKAIAEAQNLFDYKLKALLSRHDSSDAHGKSAVAGEMLSTISKIQDAVLRGEYIKKLSEELKVQESFIIEELNKIKPDKIAAFAPNLNPGKKSLEINPAEKLLIKFMLEEKESIERIKSELTVADFLDERTRKIVSVMYDLFTQGKSVEPNTLMNYFSEEDAAGLVCESMFMPELLVEEREKAISDCIKRLKSQGEKARRELLHNQIKSAQLTGDEGRLNVLMHEFHGLLRKG